MRDILSPVSRRLAAGLNRKPGNKGAPAEQRTSHDVFISYAHEDTAVARELIKVLEHAGWSTFIDRDITAGQDYSEVIDAVLESARCIIVLWSDFSVNSYWVRGEAQRGLERGLIVPVAIDRVRAPLPFNAVESIELHDWPNSHCELELRRLVAAIGHTINQSEFVPPQLPIRDEPTMSMRIEKRVMAAFTRREAAAGELERRLEQVMQKAHFDPREACAELVSVLQQKLSCHVILDDSNTVIHRAPAEVKACHPVSAAEAGWQLVVQSPDGSLTLTCLGNSSPDLDLKIDVLRQVLTRISSVESSALRNSGTAN